MSGDYDWRVHGQGSCEPFRWMTFDWAGTDVYTTITVSKWAPRLSSRNNRRNPRKPVFNIMSIDGVDLSDHLTHNFIIPPWQERKLPPERPAQSAKKLVRRTVKPLHHRTTHK